MIPGRHKAGPPSQSPRDWVELKKGKPAELVEGLIPKDIDLHLPYQKEFNLFKFRNVLAKYNITIDIAQRQKWRYILICNMEDGPFGVDLIEPHVAGMCSAAFLISFVSS